MPLLFIGTLAIFEFGILGLIQQLATTAVIEAGREGAKFFPASMSNDDVADQIQEVANQFLAVQGLEVVGNGFPDTSRANAYLIIERGTNAAVYRGGAQAATYTRIGPAPDPSGSEIVVTLCFPLVDPAQPSGNGHPLPDWLSTFGFTLKSYSFQMSSRASLE